MMLKRLKERGSKLEIENTKQCIVLSHCLIWRSFSKQIRFIATHLKIETIMLREILILFQKDFTSSDVILFNFIYIVHFVEYARLKALRHEEHL